MRRSAASDAIAEAFGELKELDREAVRKQRRQEFLQIGRMIT